MSIVNLIRYHDYMVSGLGDCCTWGDNLMNIKLASQICWFKVSSL